MLADIVVRLADALVMAAHAGDAVGDREILADVAHDLGRALVEPLAVGRVQVIGLEAVRQAEDGLAAVMLEAVVAVRAERMLEEALLPACRRKSYEVQK